MKDVSVQAVRDALKAGKFPNARRNGEAPRGDWRIPMQDVIAWKPRRMKIDELNDIEAFYGDQRDYDL